MTTLAEFEKETFDPEFLEEAENDLQDLKAAIDPLNEEIEKLRNQREQLKTVVKGLLGIAGLRNHDLSLFERDVVKNAYAVLRSVRDEN